MTDPFERVTIDLESALSELTASTRARLDDIGPGHDDARPVVARVAVAKARPPARTLSAARLPSSPAPRGRVGSAEADEREPAATDGGADDDAEVSRPAPTAVPSRSATPHSPSSVGFYSTVRLRPRVASRPARVGLPSAAPAVEPAPAMVAAPVDEPVLELPVDEPVSHVRVDHEPVDHEPVDDLPVDVPVPEEQVAELPLDEEPVVADEPVDEDLADAPVLELPVDEPVDEEAAPVDEEAAPVEEPVAARATTVAEPDLPADSPHPGPSEHRDPAPVPAYAVAPRLLGRDRPLRQAAPPKRPARRGAALAAVGVAAAVLVLVVGFLASGPLRDDATRQAVAPAALPAAPGAAPSPGRLTDIAVRPDGSVAVTEWLNLTSEVRSVRILPAAGRRARVSEAVVEGAGQARIDLGGSAAPQVVTFDEGVDRVLVRYTVADAVSLSAQDPDRALLDFPLLGMSAPRDALSGPAVVRVSDARVLGAACGLSKSSAEPCGMQRDRGWRVGKAAKTRSSVLLASVDLG